MVALKVGIISDIHIGPRASYGGQVRKVTEHAQPLTAAFVERMNTVFRPDLVLNLGDVVQDLGRAQDLEGYAEIFETLAGLEAPMYPILGNHDVIEMSTEDVWPHWQRLSHLAGLGAGPERMYYSFVAGGWTFVALHSHEVKDSHIYMDDAQIGWLEETLDQACAPAVVFVHHTLADQNTADNHWFERHPHLARIRERGRVRQVIEASGKVRAVINGHLHWNNLTSHAGIPYITVQSPIENALGLDPPEPCGAWSELVLGDGGLELEVFGADPARWSREFS